MSEKDNFNRNEDENNNASSQINDVENQDVINDSINQEFSYEWGNDSVVITDQKASKSSSKNLKVLLAISLTLLLISIMFIMVLVTSRDDTTDIISESETVSEWKEYKFDKLTEQDVSRPNLLGYEVTVQE